MCYADITSEINGTYTAFCWCGWVEHDHTDQESADVAAETHQNADTHTDDMPVLANA